MPKTSQTTRMTTRTVENEGTCRGRAAIGSRNFSPHNFESRLSNPVSEDVASCVRPLQIRHFSREMYACKNSKPPGLEFNLKHDNDNTNTTTTTTNNNNNNNDNNDNNND